MGYRLYFETEYNQTWLSHESYADVNSAIAEGMDSILKSPIRITVKVLNEITTMTTDRDSTPYTRIHILHPNGQTNIL